MNDAFIMRVDPRVKLAVVALVTSLSVLVDHPGALVSLLLPGLIWIALLPLSWRTIGGIAGLSLAVLWGAVITQGFFYVSESPTVLLTLVPRLETPLGTFPGLILTLDGMLYGLVQGCRLVAAVLVGVALVLSTSPHRLLAGLNSLGVPGWLAMVTLAALRFLPTLATQWQQVRQVQWLRGNRARWWRNPIRWLFGEFALLEPLLSATLRSAANLATSITIRGFDPSASRTPYPPLRMTPIEKRFTILLLIAALLTFTERILHWSTP